MNLKHTANKYSQYAKNIYSQHGEDGILKAILEDIPYKNNWCVEFGAWDGIFLSNTYNLIEAAGYKSVLIEADSKKFQVLKANLARFDAVLVNKFVSFEGENTLDNILSGTNIPNDFDVLSIDIDGNDYHILDSLRRYRPKLICIEYNPTIPNDVEYVQKKDFSVHFGSSALSILNLAKSKDYRLVAVTKCNLILADAEIAKHLDIASDELEDFRDDSEYKVYCFVGYTGELCLSKPLVLPWHNLTFDVAGIQVIPKFLRRFRATYSWVHKVIFYFYSKFKK